MNRRSFLSGVTATAASGSVAKDPHSVTYNVKGFTCITCAVGLEVMLRGLKGVTQANASYPANTVGIEFDRRAIGEKTIREFIATCGFSIS